MGRLGRAACTHRTPYTYAQTSQEGIMPERIYNPITAMGFSAMFIFQLDNTKR